MSQLSIAEQLTPADHQTHRRYPFTVPPGCAQLEIHVAYAPKTLPAPLIATLREEARARQQATIASRVGAALADAWSQQISVGYGSISNLATISLDDAEGRYRGANHRQAADQRLLLAEHDASPGLVPGALPAGTWTLTLTAHTLVSPQVEVNVEIQIGAETASIAP